MEQAGPIQLAIYSLMGERVYTTELPGFSGLNQLNWSLRNQDGSQVASGLYLYRAQFDGLIYTGKVAVIH